MAVVGFVCRITVQAVIPVTTQLEVLYLTAIAAVLGALIGVERRRADKPAGMRTQALVCAASALVVAIGRAIESAAGTGDPTRPLHAVITGIGFLGAGSIVHSGTGGSAKGMTTAAAVFTTAAVGVTVGIGAPISAVGATLVTLFVLRGVRIIEGWLRRSGVAVDDEA